MVARAQYTNSRAYTGTAPTDNNGVYNIVWKEKPNIRVQLQYIQFSAMVTARFLSSLQAPDGKELGVMIIVM